MRFVPNPDYHGTVSEGLTFRAWDQTSGTNGDTADTSTHGGSTAFSTATETARIIVNPVNDAPHINDQSFSVNEGSPEGTVVGTVAATDPDSGQTLTFAITAGNDAGAFAIDASTAEITVASSLALDYETTPSYALTVEVSDDGSPSLSAAATVTISVINANSRPRPVKAFVTADEDTETLFRWKQ